MCRYVLSKKCKNHPVFIDKEWNIIYLYFKVNYVTNPYYCHYCIGDYCDYAYDYCVWLHQSLWSHRFSDYKHEFVSKTDLSLLLL